MFAKSLERILLRLIAGADFTALGAADMEHRFQSLRDSGKLPRGRERRAARLSAPRLPRRGRPRQHQTAVRRG